MSSSPTTSFWDSLAASGVSLATSVVSPLGEGISKSIGNLVDSGKSKVTALSRTIVQTTDPNAVKSQPAAPPTTATKPAPTPQGLAAAAQTRTLLVLLVGLIVLFFFVRRKGL